MGILTSLSLAQMKLRCCRRMGAANAKLDKKLIVDETSPPFDSQNNPMDSRSDLDRKDSCAKTDSLYRSDSLHPLGSPTFSTFGTFTATSAIVEQIKDRSKRAKVTERITKSASEPNLLEESPVTLPHTFTGAPPSHVSELLRESNAKPHSGSTVSLVPGPSLTHSTPPPSSLFTAPQPSQTLTPVYIIPPEVEKVEVRPGRSPQPTRKLPAPVRLNSAASMSSLGSTSSGQPNSLSMLSESSEPMRTPSAETDQRSPVFRAVTMIKGSESSPRHEAVRDSTVSSSSVISYFLTQESLPGHRFDAKLSMCDLPESKPPPFCKVPSPLRIRTDKAARSETTVSDMKQRALPPTPYQFHTHTPLARTSGTLPLKRYHSPLLSSEQSPDETSLDVKRSRGAPPTLKQGQEAMNSWTLPTKKRGHNLVLKSVTHTDPIYHQLEPSSHLADSATSDMPPPRPPRKLIDPTRQVDFSHLIRSGASSVTSDASDGVRGDTSDGVRGEGADIWSRSDREEECMNCGRHIRAEPFYICVADSEDGSTRGSANNTPETTETTESVNVTTATETTPIHETVDQASMTDTVAVHRLSDPDATPDRPTTPDGHEDALQSSHPELSKPITTHPEEGAPIISEPSSPVSPMSTGAPQTESTLDSLSEHHVSGDSQATLCGSSNSITRLPKLELAEELTPHPPTGPATLLADEDGFSFEEELQPGSVICMDCVRKEGPIYHELEPAEIEAILSGADPSAPSIPPRERPSRPNPVYERVASVKRKLTLKLSTGSRIITRVSVDGAYIIEASKPRTLKYTRRDSSTDYEQVSTDQDTPTPHYHRASEVHQQGVVPLPSHLNPADHVRCKPHPPPLAALVGNQSGSHDYESLPGSVDGHVVSLRGLGSRRGSHDYAFIGPAPSIESLNERSVSPPYAPPGGNRATLMKIDSQGYASVIIPDHTDDLDCLKSTDRECPFHASMDSVDSVGQTTMRVPNDYEVPTISSVSAQTSPVGVSEEAHSRATPVRLARQRAVSEASEVMTETLQFTERESIISIYESDPRVEGTVPAGGGTSVEPQVNGTESAVTVGDRGVVKSVADRDSAIGSEDLVFDSGIENSNEGFEITSPQAPASSMPIPPPQPPRPLSLSELHIDATLVNSDAASPRPRSKTFHNPSLSPQKSNKKLNILLNQQSSVVI